MSNNSKNNSPFKVCYFLKRYPRLSETFIVNEMQELRRLGVNVTIVAQGDPNELVVHEKTKSLKVPIYYVPPVKSISRESWLVKYLRNLSDIPREMARKNIRGGMSKIDYLTLIESAMIAPLIQSLGIDLIHAHFATWATTAASFVSKLTNIPYSFTAHAKDIYHESVDRKALAEKMAQAKFVITVSNFNKIYLEECLKTEGKLGRIIRLYNGIDLNQFKPSHTKKDSNLIVSVGRLVQKKGFEYLIDACNILNEKGMPFHCMIIGEGEERTALENLVKKNSLENKVKFTGAQTQKEVIRMIQKSAIFVLPCIVGDDGNRDGLPTVLLESMALGVPVISTTTTGIPEIIENKKTGILVPPKNALQLANSIEEVLIKPELQENLQREGRLRAEKVFNIEENVRVLHNIITQSITNLENIDCHNIKK